MSVERTYIVHGMTCGHCTASVTEEVTDVPGVESVDVDLPTGRVTVQGRDVDDAAVRQAITVAGYEIAVR